MNESRIKIIYIDETCFTKRTIKTHAYAGKGQNITADESRIYSRPTYVIAGVSQERGVELVKNESKPLNAESFIEYV